jgi:hypothetical protein
LLRKGSIFKTRKADWKLVTSLYETKDYATGKPCKVALAVVKAWAPTVTRESRAEFEAAGNSESVINCPAAGLKGFASLKGVKLIFPYGEKEYGYYVNAIQSAAERETPAPRGNERTAAKQGENSHYTHRIRADTAAQTATNLENTYKTNDTSQRTAKLAAIEPAASIKRPPTEYPPSWAIDYPKIFLKSLRNKKNIMRDFPRLTGVKYMRFFKRLAATAVAVAVVVSSNVAYAAAPTPKEVCGYEPLNPKFATLTREVDALFGTTIADGQPRGMLYTIYGKADSSTMGYSQSAYDLHEEALKNYQQADYYTTVYNPNFQKFLETPNTQTKLKEIAMSSFDDLNPTDWFLQYIPLPVYYGAVNGVPAGDKTEFQGNRAVSRAEFHTIFALATNKDSYYTELAKTSSTARDINARVPNAWYAKYYNASRLQGVSELDMQAADFNAPMTRMEVAQALAKFLGYTSKYEPKNNPFSDLKLSTKGWDWDNTSSLDVFKYEIAHPSEGITKNPYNSILYLNEKGIMVGSGGKVNPTQPVTRAETIVLLQKVMKVKGEMFK